MLWNKSIWDTHSGYEKKFFKKNIVESNLDIYVIAFNNLKAIELLHIKMRSYLKNPYDLIIVDISSSTVVSNHLYAFAKKIYNKLFEAACTTVL